MPVGETLGGVDVAQGVIHLVVHPGLVTPQSMAPHLDEKRLNISSFRISLTSFTGLVPLAASRQLSSLMI